MDHSDRLSRADRLTSGLLALVWLGVGFAAIGVAVRSSRWLPGVLGVAAVAYGFLWARVVRLGHRLTGREALTPWRVGRRPDG